jgi:hypothetical protein
MVERVSSSLTFFYKFIFFPIWSVGFGFGTITMIISPVKDFKGDLLIFGVGWVLGSVFLYLSGRRLKRVEICNGNIIVSNYFKVVTIPGHDIETVTQNRFINTREITIRLRNETAFGRKIVFMPKFSLRLFSEDTVVKRLRNLGTRIQ